MSILRTMLDRWKQRRNRMTGAGKLAPGDSDAPPVIMTQWGPVTESARHRAALNMRDDPSKRLQVETLLANQLFGGDIEKGREESMRRYPEGYR